jgi:hypothetical protein
MLKMVNVMSSLASSLATVNLKPKSRKDRL